MVKLVLLLMGISSICKATPIQIFGDSIFATRNKGVRTQLQHMTGQAIADYSQTGKWAWEIKNQYIYADKTDMHTVILDGGGNDLFGSNCRYNISSQCRQNLINASLAIRDLFDIIANENRQHIIFVGGHYPLGRRNGYNQAVDFCYDLITPICEQAKIPCTLIDLRHQFEGHADWLEWDGVHPNGVGVTKIAERIFEKLQ